MLSEVEKLSTNDDTSLFDEDIHRNLTIMAASLLIAPLLSTRYRGYGHWIDTAFKEIHELLADPELREQIRNKNVIKNVGPSASPMLSSNIE